MRRILQFQVSLMSLLLAVSWPSGFAQETSPLTLRTAVAMALEKNPDRKIALADVAAAQTGLWLARTALLPSLAFSEAVTRGNDPVYVFGSRLRQEQFTQGDFALNELNRPTPFNNFTSRFSGSWTAFDSWRTQFEIRRADLAVKGATDNKLRSEQQIVERTINAYESILFAMKQVEVAQHSVDTAKALDALSKDRVDAGIAVDADQLSATSYLAERQQDLIAAQGQLQVAWAELETSIGAPIPLGQPSLEPLTEKHFDIVPLSDEISTALKSRPDKQRLIVEQDSESTAVRSARSAFGPRINAFGSWQSDRPSFSGSGGNNWLAGGEIRIDILPAAKLESLAKARIALQRTLAVTASADQQIQLQVTRAYYEHVTAEQMLFVAGASQAQTGESLRILQNRYEAGLATMTDLLRAEDAQRQSQANYWRAVYRNALTYADLKFATGTLTPESAEDLK